MKNVVEKIKINAKENKQILSCMKCICKYYKKDYNVIKRYMEKYNN